MKKTEPIWVLGAMSGTSLDGVDAAMLLTDGETIYGFGKTGYRPYSDAERQVLRTALGKWVDVQEATELVETAHAELLSEFPEAQLVGFHGQTLAHDPRGRGTFQAGDGGILAEVLDRPVIWDFRSNDVEMGGQGAPLAPFFHFACARWIDAKEPLAFLNLGGVGNMTWIDPSKSRPEQEGALLAFDTGPANAPINDLMQARRGVSHDEGGALAAEGVIDEKTIADFLHAAYFSRIPPKSLDRNDFPKLSLAVEGLSDADAAATLTAAAAASVAVGMQFCPEVPVQVLVTGGGRRNPVLMHMLAERLPCPVVPVEDVGLDGDMLEAQAFAHLAVRVLRGLPTSSPSTTGVAAAVGGGRISRPGQVLETLPS
jgi:anhydro-N-acetylmuramic acid kinase